MDSECSRVSKIICTTLLNIINCVERNFTPYLSHGIGATAEEISIKANVNATSSRIFNPENLLKSLFVI